MPLKNHKVMQNTTRQTFGPTTRRAPAGFGPTDLSFSGCTATGTLVATVIEIAPNDGTTFG